LIFAPVFGFTPIRALRCTTFEGPQNRQLDLLAFLQAGFDRIDDGFDRTLCLALCWYLYREDF
jgi:hypothetical protein